MPKKRSEGGAAAPAKRPRTRLSPEERTEHLLDAAADVVIESGIEGLTMEAVAERASVSRALSYFYFESRTELIRALYNRELGHLYDAVLPALEGGGTLEERVRAGVRAHFDVVDRRHDLFAILSSAVGGSEYRSDRHKRHRSWEEYVSALASDEFHVSSDEARVLARLLINVNARCAILWKRDGLDRNDVENMCVSFQLGGLREVLRIDTSMTSKARTA